MLSESALARINRFPDVHGSAAVLIVEREGLDVIAACNVFGKVHAVQPTTRAAIVRMRIK